MGCLTYLNLKSFLIVHEEFMGVTICRIFWFFITHAWAHFTHKESDFLLKAHKCLNIVALCVNIDYLTCMVHILM